MNKRSTDPCLMAIPFRYAVRAVAVGGHFVMCVISRKTASDDNIPNPNAAAAISSDINHRRFLLIMGKWLYPSYELTKAISPPIIPKKRPISTIGARILISILTTSK